jgi:hypothetical protein
MWVVSLEETMSYIYYGGGVAETWEECVELMNRTREDYEY